MTFIQEKLEVLNDKAVSASPPPIYSSISQHHLHFIKIHRDRVRFRDLLGYDSEHELGSLVWLRFFIKLSKFNLISTQ